MCYAVRFVRSVDTGYLRASNSFSVPRANSGEEPTSPSPEKLVNVHLGRKTVLPIEPEDKLVRVLQNYEPKLQLTERSGHKIHGFSVGNKKWFEASI